LFRLVGANLTPTQNTTLPFGFYADVDRIVNVTTPSGGGTVIAGFLDATTTNSPTWNNATADTVHSETGNTLASAHRLTAGAATVKLSFGAEFMSGLIAVSFAP
jgi:hypothetical protein